MSGAVSSLAQRFWAKVDKRSADECWLWQACRNREGYGQFSQNGRQRGAHVVAWELANDAAAAGFVCHRCDNPSCCNPAHLFVGTHSDNMRDRVAKGRQFIRPMTMCQKGLHPFDEPYVQGRSRRCKPCTTARYREYRQARKAGAR